MLDILRQGAQSWGIKILFGIIIAVFVLAFGMDPGQNDKTSVVATVNDSPILFQHYQERLQRSLELVRGQNPNLTPEMLAQMGFKRQVLEQMITEELMLQQAAQLGLTVSREELANEIHLIPAFQNEAKIFDAETYQNVLRANNLTPGTFESEYQRGMLMDKLRSYLGMPGRIGEDQARDFYEFGRSTAVIAYRAYPWGDFQDQVNATEERVAEYYAARTADFAVPARARVAYLLLTPGTLADVAAVSDQDKEKYYAENKDSFKVEEQVRARHILVRVEENATQAEVDKAMGTISKARADLKAGKSFADVAAKYTEDPSGAQTGGELGWFGRGRMVKPFEDAAFALAKGQVSEPVRTQFGFHLIQTEDRREAGYEQYADVAKDIARMIAQDRAMETMQDRLDQVLETVLVGGTLDAAATSVGLGLEVRTTDFFTRQQGPGELPGLSPENIGLLFDLAVNATTQSPLAYQDGYVLATKLEQAPESVRALEEVRPQIMASIIREEAMKVAKAAAEKDLALLVKGEQVSNTTETVTAPFIRQGSIPGLGANQQLSAQAFQTKPGTWLPEPFAFPLGYVLARTVEITTPDAAAWEKEKELWLTSLNQRAEDQTVQAFLADLRAKADVQITNPALIEN